MDLADSSSHAQHARVRSLAATGSPAGDCSCCSLYSGVGLTCPQLEQLHSSDASRAGCDTHHCVPE